MEISVNVETGRRLRKTDLTRLCPSDKIGNEMPWNSEGEEHRDWLREEQAGEHYLPTLSLIHIPHPKIPHLYQRCFEYTEPWQWSPVTELVETGQWVVAKRPDSVGRGGE